MINLGKYLFGIREEYVHDLEEESRDSQFLSYNLLSLMFLILVLMSVVSGIVYGLIIFQEWIPAVFTGIFLGGVTFLLLLLVLFLNMTTRHKELYGIMTDATPLFNKYTGKNYVDLEEHKLARIVSGEKQSLRERNIVAPLPEFHFSGIVTSTIKVSLVLIISCIVANGLELWMFKNKINESIATIGSSKELELLAVSASSDSMRLDSGAQMAKWTWESVKNGDGSFKMIDCNSLLLTVHILDNGLGNWKLLIDFLFALLYLVPFIIVRRSKRFAGGAFLKEAAIIDISTSLMFYLLAQRKRGEIKKAIHQSSDYDKFLKPLSNESSK